MTQEISRRSILRGVGATALAVPFVSGLAACSKTEGGGKNSAEGDGQSLKVAIGNEPPYTKLNTDGTVTGAEPDVLQAVLTRMGYGKIEGVVAGYDGMIAGLNGGRWDVVAAGLFMKQSRCAAVQYTSPVIVDTESFAVMPGNPKGITTVADVKKDPSIKVAAITGAFEDGILKEAGVGTNQILGIKDTVSGVEALKAGRVQAFLLPTLSLESFKKEQGGFEITPGVEDAPKSGSGAAFRKDDKELWEAYNKEVEEFKKTDEFANILDKWGFDADNARGVTVAELCKNPG